jgi:hypothetical protein
MSGPTPGTPVIYAHPANTSGLFGAVVANVGDIDGDGNFDFATSAPGGGSNPNGVYVMLPSGVLTYAPGATAAGLGHSLAGLWRPAGARRLAWQSVGAADRNRAIISLVE